MDSLIAVSHLTKDYGGGRGAFDVSFRIASGECFGFLGPNGAGKTTVIRHLMGFSKPDSGTAEIAGVPSWDASARMMNRIGYLPGEISLPSSMRADGFLGYQRKLRGMEDLGRASELAGLFEFDMAKSIASMSLGERRKLAVIAAFMHDPDILVLDEPTSGLDPIMQDVFIEFVKREKERGKTILLSSHIFNEVAAVCDHISIIKQGHIVEEFGAEDLGSSDDGYQGSLLSAVLKNPLHGGAPYCENVCPGGASASGGHSDGDSPRDLAGDSVFPCGSERADARFDGLAVDGGNPGDVVIRARDLTKDYGVGRGVFDLDLDVKRGEVMGLVGTNGSGKTTTIRMLMGFVKPDAGEARIFDSDTWRHAPELMRDISYIPGEIQFPSFKSANAFFDYQARLLGLEDLKRRERLIETLRLDASVNPRSMSKGMKQKTSIVAALMAENDVLIMDEPTTGLDPVMRDVFVDLIKQEKAAGRTILLSSHLFEEIEEVCDRVTVIDGGRVVDVLTVEELESYRKGTQDQQRIRLEERFKQIFKKEN